MDIKTELNKLTDFLKANYPQVVPIPTTTKKEPLYAFKDTTTHELWNIWNEKGMSSIINGKALGVALLLRDEWIVIDFDNIDQAQLFEDSCLEFQQAPKQETNKGCHFYFKRTPFCDESNLFCHIRPFENIDVDILTKRHIGKEAGLISVYPSPNKRWVRSIYDTPLINIPQTFVEFYNAKCKNKQTKPKEGLSQDDNETNNTIDYETLKDIVMNLNPSRANGYDDWTRVVWAVGYESRKNGYIRKGKNLIHEFSKQSDKYDEDKVEDFIDTKIEDRKDGVKLGSLLGWLKQDNKFVYNRIQDKLTPKVKLNGYSFIEEPPFDVLDGEMRCYKTVKPVFELRFFKVMRPLLYTQILENGDCYFRDTKTLKETYCNVYCNVEITKKGITSNEDENLINVWIKDPKIRTYDTIDFLPPPLQCPQSTFNMWRGFDVERLDVESSGNVEPFLKHISIWTNHNEQGNKYFIKWLADMFQNPGKLNGIAIVAKSEQGAGKNIFLEGLAQIMGNDLFYETANPKEQLWARFSLGRKNRLLINIDETKGKDTYPMSDVIKNMITSKFYNYEEKGKKPITLTNINRIIFTTNNTCSIKVEQKDRRFVVFECSQEMLGNKQYFDNLGKYFDDPTNQKAVFEYLMSIDVSNVDWIGERPMTDLYKDIQNLNAPNSIKFFIHLCENNGRDKIFRFEGVMLFFEYYKDILTKCGYSTDGFKKDKFLMDMRPFILVGRYGDFEQKQCIRKIRGDGTNIFKIVCDDVRNMLVKGGYIKENDYMFIEDYEDF